MKDLYLRSGELAVSDKSAIILNTMVGVCVAVSLWDKKEKCGGLCHYRLPVLNSDFEKGLKSNDYGTEAIVNLISKFKQMGSSPGNIKAQVIGGSEIKYESNRDDVGMRNVEVAFQVLQNFGIEVVGKATGGGKGRQVRFNSSTGKLNYRELNMRECVGLMTSSSSLKWSKGMIAENYDLNEETCMSSLIVIGASTGGVEALETVLKQLPKISPPICIVQHIPESFSNSLAEQLNNICALNVTQAIDGEELECNHIYIAKGGRHMRLKILGSKLIIRLGDDEENNGFKPSVDCLFNSAIQIHNKNIIGVLLTGMGMDGAAGLLKLKNNGAYTIVQNEETSVVWGMAQAASDMGAVDLSVSLSSIAGAIQQALMHTEKFNKLAIH